MQYKITGFLYFNFFSTRAKHFKVTLFIHTFFCKTLLAHHLKAWQLHAESESIVWNVSPAKVLGWYVWCFLVWEGED